MKALETKIPPPIVTAVVALIMSVIESLSGPSFELNTMLSIVIVTSLAAGGMLTAILGNVAFNKAKTTGNPIHPEKASSLVSGGIYRVTRNPMYLGSALVLLAWAVHLSSVWTFIGVPIFMFYIGRFQIIPEERALEKLFGEDFKNYCSKVRRWI